MFVRPQLLPGGQSGAVFGVQSSQGRLGMSGCPGALGTQGDL